MIFGGEANVPGAAGNVARVNSGGIPNLPLDQELLRRLQQPGTPPPSGFREQFNIPANPGSAPQAYLNQSQMIAGSPSFDINKSAGPLGNRPGEQLKRLYEGGTQQNQQLNEELKRRGILPGSGPQLPLALGGTIGPVPMGNAGFFAGPQYGQQVAPPGFQNKFVS